MGRDNILIGVLIEETTTYTVKQVCNKYNIPKELLIEMMEQGLFSNKTTRIDKLELNEKELRRIESAFRLHRDLGINLPGVALALDLLDQIEQMHHELDIFRKHF